jgi:hypothetical protein
MNNNGTSKIVSDANTTFSFEEVIGKVLPQVYDFLPTKGEVVWEHTTESGGRVVWYSQARVAADGGQKWVRGRDLSIDRSRSAGALNALARFLAGDIRGKNGFIQTAPDEVLTGAYGNGAFGWVFGSYDGTYYIDTPEGKLFVAPPVEGMPSEDLAVRHVYALMGRLMYRGDQQEISYTSDQNMFWTALVWKALLEGCNVSISLGNEQWENSQKVAKIAAAETREDKTSLAGAFAYDNRQSRKAAAERAVETQNLRAVAVANGGDLPEISSTGLLVPTREGGQIDLLQWDGKNKVRLAKYGPEGVYQATLNGMACSKMNERISMHSLINASNGKYKVDLTASLPK